ncbi:MAG: glycosyltransferase [Rikenellaceae bacterium]
MLSILICSINPTLVAEFSENVAKTIGDIPYEIIVHDNRGSSEGICSVYNRLASKAKGDNLLFAHEDICFHTPDWGTAIIEKLSDKTTGAIGFAGATVKTKTYSGWYQSKKYHRINMIQCFKDKPKITISRIDKAIKFAPVVTLDGMAIFARRELWAEHPFDEDLLTGFHCYDLDFSLTLALDYTNYVCNCVLVEHFSDGSYNATWVNETIKLHDNKWRDKLPISVDKLSFLERLRREHSMKNRFRRIIKKTKNK